MKDRIKALYDEANSLHVQARGILAEYNGKDLPQEKATQVDTLFDQVQAKVDEAKRLERAEEQNKFLNDPVTRKGFYQDKEHGQLGNGDDRTKAQQDTARKAAWLKYAQAGLERLTEAEYKDLSVGTPAAGGYLTVDTWLGEMISLAREVFAMRRICRTLPAVPVGSVITPAEDSAMDDATWTTEILTGSADTSSPFGQRKLTPHPLAKRVLVARDLLRNPAFDAEAFVREAMAYKHALPEEEAFINGTGVNAPKGILQTTGLSSYTTAAALTLTADDVINWVYSLGATYANNRTRIVCNRSFIRMVRKLKDGVGNYVWQAGLQSGVPNMILDTPYELSDRVATGLTGSTWIASSVVAVIFDPSYYWIVDAMGMEIQRLNELYAATNQVGFIGRKQTDGMLVRSEAAYSLTIHA
jgi:HK97 family phage major capsid protein